jgi:chromosome segregation ATPase
MQYTSAEQNSNENLVNEYINVLAKKLSDVSLEVVTIQAKANLANKEKEQLLKTIEKLNKDVDSLNAEVIREREKEPITKEVIKEVEVIKEIPVEADSTLVKENEYLKRELISLEKKIKILKSQLKSREEENVNGRNTET